MTAETRTAYVLLSGGPLDGQQHAVADPAPGVRLVVPLAPDLRHEGEEPASLVQIGERGAATVYHRHADGVYRTIGQSQAVYEVEATEHGMEARHVGTERGGGEPWPGEPDGRWRGDAKGAIELWG